MEKLQLQKLLEQAREEIKNCFDLEQLQALKVIFLGKKSHVAILIKELVNLEHQEKIVLGKEIANFRHQLNEWFDQQQKLLKEKAVAEELKKAKLDITLPGNNFLFANQHPLNLVMQEISDIFLLLGYEIVHGQEVETDEYNFERLNLEKDHPARATQDSFYINNDFLLRTHSTNMTARYLEKYQDFSEPIAVISMGNVYRRDDDDATHSHQFMQIDGFLIAPQVNFANLKWTLNYLITKLFGSETKMRLRPSYFPFTEPSVEVDISCVKCQGKGCSLCKRTGWIEVLGAGMISPYVFAKNNLPTTLQGFAFGVGVERIAMLKYGIDDIRLFYKNDIRFLKQFNNF